MAGFFNDMLRGQLKEGSNLNMAIDASGGDKVYKFTGHATDTYEISRLKLVISTDTLTFDYSKFIEGTGLSSGVLMEIRTESVTSTLGNAKMSEDNLQIRIIIQ